MLCLNPWVVLLAGGLAWGVGSAAAGGAGDGSVEVVFRAVFFVAMGAVLVPALASVEGVGAGAPHPGLPVGERTRGLAEGLAWVPPMLLGGAAAAGVAALAGHSGEARPEALLRGLPLLLPVATMSSWQRRRPGVLAVVPGAIIGGAAAALARLPTGAAAMGSATLVGLVLLAGPWLVASGFQWPGVPRPWRARGATVGPRRSASPSRNLDRDAALAVIAGPLQMLPAILASLLVVAGFVLAFLLLLPLSQSGTSWKGVAFGALSVTVPVTAAIALLLAPMTHLLGAGSAPVGEAAPQAERLLQCWERLPVSLRRVRTGALLCSLASTFTAAVVVLLCLATLEIAKAWPTQAGGGVDVRGPDLAAILRALAPDEKGVRSIGAILAAGLAWAAFWPAAALGDRPTRKAALGLAFPAAGILAAIGNTAGMLPALASATWIYATTALALTLLLLRPGARGRL